MTQKKKTKKKPAEEGEDGIEDVNAQCCNTSVTLVISPQVQRYVTLDMRLLNWSYLNFKLRVKTSTRLFALKQQIMKRHGPVKDLKVCKGHFSEANEMVNDMESLEEHGIIGAPENEPEMICVIHYDFKPEQHDNPLLLAS